MGTALLGMLEREGSDVVERLRAGVVSIRSRAGGGSGTAWGEDGGLIVTNNHVVDGDRTDVLTWDGRSFTGTVVATDREHDLAAIEPGVKLDGLSAADSSAVRAGQLALAVGNPWGQRGFVTAGIIMRTPGNGRAGPGPLGQTIQADVALAPGNSGGPLADARGHVIGINSMIAGGIAVAIPSNVVAEFVAGLAAPKGVLGISAQPVPLPGQGDEAAGLLITEIATGSPAEAAGLLPGDIMVALDGASGSVRALARGLGSMRSGTPNISHL